MYIIFLVSKMVNEETLESEIYVDSLYALETYKIVDFDRSINPVERFKQREILTGQKNEKLDKAISDDSHVIRMMGIRKSVNHRMTMHGIYYDGDIELTIDEVDFLLDTKKKDGTLKEFLDSSTI